MYRGPKQTPVLHKGATGQIGRRTSRQLAAELASNTTIPPKSIDSKCNDMTTIASDFETLEWLETTKTDETGKKPLSQSPQPSTSAQPPQPNTSTQSPTISTQSPQPSTNAQPNSDISDSE